MSLRFAKVVSVSNGNYTDALINPECVSILEDKTLGEEKRTRITLACGESIVVVGSVIQVYHTLAQSTVDPEER